MPANRKNLTWLEVADFTAGLFGEVDITKQQVLIPQAGFARMQCYYPLKQGGLRAFYRTVGSVTCSGRTAGSHGSNNEAPVGLFAHGNTGIGYDNLILVTHNSNDHKDRVYYFNGVCGAPSTTWCVADVSAAASGDAVPPPDFAFFDDNVSSPGYNQYYYVMVLRGKDEGIYTITYNPNNCSGASGITHDGYTQDVAGPSGSGSMTGPVGINGARLLVGDGTVGSELWWTGEGVLSFEPGGSIYDPNDTGAGMRGIVSMQPDQFLVMRGGAPWLQFSGDVGTTGTNRVMGSTHTGGASFQQPVRVPNGVAFIEPGGYIYVTDGNTFEAISDQIPAFSSQVLGDQSASSVTGVGQLSYLNDFLFAPDGKVYKWDTKSWFTLEDSTAQTAATPQGIYYTIREDGTPVNYIAMFQGTGATRASCGNFQTAPYADKDGRNVEIREVQVFLQSYTASGPCATVTCDIYDGEDNLVVSRVPEGGAIPAGRNLVRFLFPYPKADYLSVRICTDGQGSNEAPTIERMRIGFGANNDILGV